MPQMCPRDSGWCCGYRGKQDAVVPEGQVWTSPLLSFKILAIWTQHRGCLFPSAETTVTRFPWNFLCCHAVIFFPSPATWKVLVRLERPGSGAFFLWNLLQLEWIFPSLGCANTCSNLTSIELSGFIIINCLCDLSDPRCYCMPWGQRPSLSPTCSYFLIPPGPRQGSWHSSVNFWTDYFFELLAKQRYLIWLYHTAVTGKIPQTSKLLENRMLCTHKVAYTVPYVYILIVYCWSRASWKSSRLDTEVEQQTPTGKLWDWNQVQSWL